MANFLQISKSFPNWKEQADKSCWFKFRYQLTYSYTAEHPIQTAGTLWHCTNRKTLSCPHSNCSFQGRWKCLSPRKKFIELSPVSSLILAVDKSRFYPLHLLLFLPPLNWSRYFCRNLGAGKSCRAAARNNGPKLLHELMLRRCRVASPPVSYLMRLLSNRKFGSGGEDPVVPVVCVDVDMLYQYV